MSVNMKAWDYTSFQAIVGSMPGAGRVFYYVNAGPKFGAAFVADDANFVVVLDTQAATPASFATDFPAAILINMPNGIGWPALGTSTYNIFGG